MTEASALLLAVFITGLIVFGLVRLTQKLSLRFYFSYIDLLRQHDLPPWGILIRILIPIVTGYAWGVMWSDYAIPVAAAGSSFGALLTVWAPIAHPYLLPPEVANRRVSTMVVFFFHITSYAILGPVGVCLAYLLGDVFPSTWLGQGIVSGLITAAIAVVAGDLFGFQRLRKAADAAAQEAMEKRQSMRQTVGK